MAKNLTENDGNYTGIFDCRLSTVDFRPFCTCKKFHKNVPKFETLTGTHGLTSNCQSSIQVDNLVDYQVDKLFNNLVGSTGEVGKPQL